ncbi:hypothetical protein B0H67DRAFT_352067 [Lasiosphaeris hirsuta]|uniref:Uncharacterized protein n=1 Tax=Lasiosphaeris hirsuta TaxID=260670 RepID=A0AA39ZW14_9PEZI|nr:hypothetical protein B0H67DRAFT_352067 [Lasiosphaeris hirsuta]
MAAPIQGLRPPSWSWARQDHQDSHSASPASPPAHTDLCDKEIRGHGLGRPEPEADCEAAVGIPHAALPADRDLWTRDLCIVGLILGWSASLSALATGIYIIGTKPAIIPSWLVNRVAIVGPMGFSWTQPTQIYMNDQRLYSVSEAAMIITPLLLQTVIASVSACLDAIHSTTLRWALWREGRLRHNTNLRLFTYARRSGPNAWPANILASLGLVLAYGGTSVMAYPLTVIAALEFTDDPSANPINYDADLGENRHGISFNGWGLLGLGIGLFLQCAICTWCLVHDFARRDVGTWNSNPLATARACRFLLSDDGSKDAPATSGSGQHPTGGVLFSSPSLRQPSMRSLVPGTRAIANWIWAIFGLHSAFVVAVALVAARVQHSASLEWVRENPAPVDFPSVWKYYGQVIALYNGDTTRLRLEWAGLLIQCAAVSTLLFGLHLAEVLAGLWRDEAIWRRAASPRRGASPESNMALENVRSWPGAVVFVYKVIVPWIFGFGFACNMNVFLALFPLLTIAVLFLILGLFSEYLIRARPRGAQPATYGEVRALVALVDDWGHDALFWGDKGEYEQIEGVRAAGTAGSPLPDLRPGVVYVGLSREPRQGAWGT